MLHGSQSGLLLLLGFSGTKCAPKVALISASNNPYKLELNLRMKTTLSVALGLFFLNVNAHAANCSQKDAAGVWKTYQAAFVAPKQSDEHVGECTLYVSRAGAIDGTKSACQFVTFNTGYIPTSGSVTVAGDCSVTVSLGLGNMTANVQMAKDKATWSGRFVAQNGTVSGTTNAVKK